MRQLMTVSLIHIWLLTEAAQTPISLTYSQTLLVGFMGTIWILAAIRDAPSQLVVLNHNWNSFDSWSKHCNEWYIKFNWWTDGTCPNNISFQISYSSNTVLFFFNLEPFYQLKVFWIRYTFFPLNRTNHIRN